MTESKAREFWIVASRDVGWDARIFNAYKVEQAWIKLPPVEQIHAIEYSAFETLERENRELREEIKNSNKFTQDKEDEIQDLKSKLEKAKTALKMKCMCWPKDDARCDRNPCHACSVVEELNER